MALTCPSKRSNLLLQTRLHHSWTSGANVLATSTSTSATSSRTALNLAMVNPSEVFSTGGAKRTCFSALSSHFMSPRRLSWATTPCLNACCCHMPTTPTSPNSSRRSSSSSPESNSMRWPGTIASRTRSGNLGRSRSSFNLCCSAAKSPSLGMLCASPDGTATSPSPPAAASGIQEDGSLSPEAPRPPSAAAGRRLWQDAALRRRGAGPTAANAKLAAAAAATTTAASNAQAPTTTAQGRCCSPLPLPPRAIGRTGIISRERARHSNHKTL
mmetsp:Transcript_95566/g.242898  ORF Transcript_95566/g.242898 Transcript_95566/m.242898 type:complete len:271 (+) Transcript_95566:335-1147(+)